MRRIGIVAAIVAVLFLPYVGSALWSVGALLVAVRAGDGPAIAEHTDIPLLRKSLVTQTVAAYFKLVNPKRPIAQIAIATYGSTIADPLIEKILSEGLTRLLQQGIVLDPVNATPRTKIAPLGALMPGELLDLLSRFEPDKPMEFRLRISGADDPRLYTAAEFRFEGTGWKLSGLRLPEAIATDLAVIIVEMTKH